MEIIMTQTPKLLSQNCIPCKGDTPPLTPEEITTLKEQLHKNWEISEDQKSITRSIKFKGFQRVVLFVNALSWIAEQEQHHPDISFGYGYCNITFTTHSIAGLSINDFICAAKVDKLL